MEAKCLKVSLMTLLLQRSSKDYFIPKKFFQVKLGGASEAEVLALGHSISKTEVGYSVDPELFIVPVSTFARTYKDIKANGSEFSKGFTALSAAHAGLMPNPLREKSGGRMVLMVPLISTCPMPQCHAMLEKEFCVRFVSSSPHAAPLELIRGVKESIEKAASDGIIAWDCKLHCEVMLIPYKLFLAGDNPMQAEECSHGGLKCNYFCRTCKVGRTTAEKKLDKGYCDIFKPGELQTPTGTLAEVKQQLELAKQSGGTEKVKNAVSKSGIRDAASAAIMDHLLNLGKCLRKREAGTPAIPEVEVRAELECEFEASFAGRSVDDIVNPLLGMAGVDIHQDMPTEILHMILLGVTRLESINKDGLNSPTLGVDYIVQFKGSLIGKHFKSLAQVMPYLIYDLVPRTVLEGWTAIGELVVLLWHMQIDNVEEYLANLSRTIEDFLSISAQCAPNILFTKAKFHFLLHLPMFIWHFGPAILFSTERFESFNHIFRLTAIYSNHQAPSRDTCQVFSEQDTVKHIVSGGFWLDLKTRAPRKAGNSIHTYMHDHPEQRHLISIPTIVQREVAAFGTGASHLPSQQDEGSLTKYRVIPPVEWSMTQSAAVQLIPPRNNAQDLFYKGKTFTTVDRDTACIDGHVILQIDEANLTELSIGKITEILIHADGRAASHILITCLDFLPELHPELHVPRIKLSEPEQKVVVTPNNILCNVNIQHDCAVAMCSGLQRPSTPTS
ncbi:hypothetical protein PAXRUDRAFT_18906 [Paxillus rubicundulus Ve08.2h10]|uniref:Uncharacterized protein n=1 Tax=Paxillus rubicundulus Ve08.2h10 TaxID=930991 RepID=A0A0D0BW41_9AGAM|nr:hypothetical protein PAXRUDRAFT_18906 [Paxillus rubicundulus Ve08.2h10]